MNLLNWQSVSYKAKKGTFALPLPVSPQEFWRRPVGF